MNKKINVYLMCSIVFLQGLVFYGSISTIYRQVKGLSMYQIFFIESVSWILMIVFEVPWGWFADRFGYKKTLIISNFLFFLSKIVFFKAAVFPVFLMERIMLSLSLAGISGCDIAFIYLSKEEHENSERIFARYRWFSTSGLLVAALVSPVLISISMEATTFFTIIPYGIASVLTLFLVDAKRETETKPSIKESFKIIIRNRGFILFVISVALIGEVTQGVTVYLNQVQYVRSGIDIKYFGILLALLQLVRLVTIKSYKLGDRFGKIKSIIGLYLIISLSCVGLMFTSIPAISIFLVCLVGGSMALIEPMAMDMQNKTITTGDRATVLSMYSMGGNIVSALINPFMGVGADISIQIEFVSCVIICIAALLLIFCYVRSRREHRSYFCPKVWIPGNHR